MSIYNRTVRGQPENPAKALYRYWHSVLMPLAAVGARGPVAKTYFGDDQYYGIGIVSPDNNHQPSVHDELEFGTAERPVLGFGYVGWGLSAKFKIRSNGEFQLLHVHGDKQRFIITNNTFLDWTYNFSEVQWFVNTGPHQYTPNLMTNWRTPIHYVGQKSIYRPTWAWRPAWLRLERVDNQWKIVFSRTSEHHYYRNLNRPDLGGATAEGFRRNEELRLKRYRRLMQAEQVKDGTIVSVGKRIIPTAEIEQRRTTQALALAAHLDVRAPAKTTPLKRSLEGV